MGYRLFALRKSTGAVPSSAAFEIAVDTDNQGWIRSLRDSRGTDLIQNTTKRTFGSLLFANQNGPYEAVPVGPAKMSTQEGPVSRRTEIVRDNSPLRRTVATVYRDAAFVDLALDVDIAAFSARSGRIAIALPLDDSKQLWLDGAGFIYRVPQDMLPGGVATQFTTGHFVHSGKAGEQGLTIATRDAALLLRDGTFLVASQGLQTQTRDEGNQRLHRTEPGGSDVQRFRFRLALQGAKLTDWQRFGQELNLPLQSSLVAHTDLPHEQSFIAVDHPNVAVTAFKTAEVDPDWSVIRLQEIGGQSVEDVRIRIPFRVSEATYANTVEAPLKIRADLSRISLRPWQTVTILARIERQK